jgi:phosphatidylinositol alpha-1,6-mannosyltransferase
MAAGTPPDPILILGEEMPPDSGGIGQWGYEMGRKLRERGLRVAYAAPAERMRPASFYDGAVDLQPIPGDDWRHHKDRRIFRALREAWRSRRPSLIICLTWKVARLPLLLRPLARWRVAVLAHGLEITKKRDRLRRRLGLRWIFGSADLSAAVSRYTRSRVLEFGVAPGNVHVVPCGVDPQRFRPRDGSALRRELGVDGRPVLLTLARLVRRKGHDLVIRALAQVRRQVPDVTYLIAGSGEAAYVESLRELARRCGVEDAVRFLGRVGDERLPELYSASLLYVMASRSNEASGNYEGFGITYLEANACGIPVIGADTGGVADAIADGETGFLVPPEDVPALTRRLLQLLEDPGLARRMGEAGRSRVLSDLSWDRVADRFLAALGEKGAPDRTRVAAARSAV